MRDTDEQETQQVVSLGSFGTAAGVAPQPAPAVVLAFQWYGERVRVNADASELDLVEFMGTVGELDETDTRAIGPVFRLLQRWVHPDDWHTFWQLCRVHRASLDSDLLPLVKALAEGTTGRPTVLPSDSSGGPSPTAQSSTAGAASRVLDGLAARGDLGRFVVMAQEYQAQQQG